MKTETAERATAIASLNNAAEIVARMQDRIAIDECQSFREPKVKEHDRLVRCLDCIRQAINWLE